MVNAGWGGFVSFAGGSSYGQSAYMLFYERRRKKPILELVSEEESKSNQEVQKVPNKDEYLKPVNYRQGVDKDKPNEIFNRVLEDNTKFKFESDVYSEEFFNFVKTILINVAEFGDSQDQESVEMRRLAIQVGQRAAFDILARCYKNEGIKDLLHVMIRIFDKDEKLCLNFMSSIVDFGGELIFEMVVDCNDALARN